MDRPATPDTAAPDSTAVRVALWRALHVHADPPPHVLVDELGAALAAPEPGWTTRPDMGPFTRPFRASIVARARFVEDLAASGTPFVSFFTADAIVALARAQGFRAAHHVSADELTARYFAGRADGLRPPRHAEELLVATT